METHWTEKLFIEHGDLIRRELEEGLKRAGGEVGALQRIFSREDVPPGGKILDLCCGIGRHSLLLAERGYRVVGVDLSPILISRAMELAKARGIEDRVEFLLGDIRNIKEVLENLSGSFHAVINMNTSLGYYGEEEDEEVLRQVWDLSSPEGVLVIDIGNRDWIIRHFLARDVSETAEGLIKVVTRSLDLESSRMENLYEYYERREEDLRRSVIARIDHRVYSLHELIRLVEKGGWVYVRSFGGFTLGSCTIDSNRIILVAKKGQG